MDLLDRKVESGVSVLQDLRLQVSASPSLTLKLEASVTSVLQTARSPSNCPKLCHQRNKSEPLTSQGRRDVPLRRSCSLSLHQSEDETRHLSVPNWVLSRIQIPGQGWPEEGGWVPLRSALPQSRAPWDPENPPSPPPRILTSRCFQSLKRSLPQVLQNMRKTLKHCGKHFLNIVR